MNTVTQPKIQKITSKGQITIPIAWRRKMRTNMIVLREAGNGIHILPARTIKVMTCKNNDEIAIFDADRDNNGIGIEAGVLADMLRRSIERDRKKRRSHGSHS